MAGFARLPIAAGAHYSELLEQLLTHDPRSAPALAKALKEHQPAKTDEDLRAPARHRPVDARAEGARP